MATEPSLEARPTRTWFRWLPLLLWLAIIVGFFRPGSVGFSWVGKQPWGDKITHILLIGGLAFFFDFALAGRRVGLGRVRVPLAIVLAAVFMTLEEVSQLWIPGRNFEWADLLANYLGITAAWLASVWLFRHGTLPSPVAPPPSRTPGDFQTST